MTKLTDKISKMNLIEEARTAVQDRSMSTHFDMQTANAIITVYDHLALKNQKIMAQIQDPKLLAAVAWEVLGKVKKS
jgi:hypothetical protein